MKNKKVLIISSIIGIILLVGIILGVLYLTTDAFKTNKQLFNKYLSQVITRDKEFLKKCDMVNEKINNNSSSVTNIDVLTSNQNQETGISDLQKILSIKSNALKNCDLKQSYRDFTISSNEQQLMTLKYIKDDNTYAIGLENILVKYIAIENSNLKDLFEKFGLQDTDEIPNSLPTDFKELFDIDDATLNKLKMEYYSEINKNISENNFSKTTNEDKTETLSVSLTEQEFANVIKALLETAKNDNTVLDLIVNKAKLFGYTDITTEYVQSEIQKNIEKISSETYMTEKDFVKIYLIKSNKLITKIGVEVNYKENLSNTNEDTMTVVTDMNNESKKYNLELNVSESNKLIYTVKENDVELNKTQLNYSYDDNSINCNIESENKYDGKSNIIKSQYRIENYQTDNILNNCTIDVNSQELGTYQVNISNETTLKKDIEIEKLTTENSAKINDMSAEQIQQLINAISAKIMVTYGEKIQNLIQQ